MHTYADRVAMEVSGHAEIVDEGALVEDMKRRLAGIGEKWWLPAVKHVVCVTVDAVVDLWPGPHAGEEVRETQAAGT